MVQGNLVLLSANLECKVLLHELFGMRLSRLFVEDILLAVGQEIVLPQESAHYLVNVLRLRVGASVILFNGQGGEYTARLVTVAKKNAKLQILEYKNIECESALQLTLVQAISRPDHMDYTIQKAVELGVQRIVPVITERSPPLDKTKISKREQHWRKIIINACEQCGRNHLPTLHHTLSLTAWFTEPQLGIYMVLSPTGKSRLHDVNIHLSPKNRQISSLSEKEVEGDFITLLIGAEGGLNEVEIQQAMQAGYVDIRLGQRILRTETAAIAVLAVCQAWWGDLH